ncbi:MAG: hypothetical protein AVO39_04645 [delta proteobacterium MLS_D]|jgi:putative FmdB family regulatory protein|nr:MAG: hypothetical protein AVO39_04645 [delta proteobacterium MLS_D]
MPIYEYRCNRCRGEFEHLGSMNDRDSEVECPLCGGRGAEKLMSRCQTKVEMSLSDFKALSGAAAGGGCAGCTSGSCSTCDK